MADNETQQNVRSPLAINQINNNMSRYETLKFPILKINEYHLCKVQMTIETLRWLSGRHNCYQEDSKENTQSPV